ncbi:transposase [Streptomyces sp. ST2-7A]|uniref:transposase n=1 Tax=Streptomyces sp. ST2-7A TaxID=2907214 RepID=UPI0035AB99C4
MACESSHLPKILLRPGVELESKFTQGSPFIEESSGCINHFRKRLRGCLAWCRFDAAWCSVPGGDLSQRLLPDGQWSPVAPLLPSFSSHPQSGGMAPVDERAIFVVMCVLASGCAWRHLPSTFDVSPATAHRRFVVWTKAGGCVVGCIEHSWTSIGARGEVDWTSAIVDAASVRAKRGDRRPDAGRSIGARRTPSRTCCPTRGVCPCPALPCPALGVSGTNVHDSQAALPLVLDIPAIRSMRGPHRGHPDKLRAGKHYHSAEYLARLRERGIVPAPRPPRDRIEQAAQPTPLKSRTLDLLTVRIPPPDRPVRTQGLTLPRVPRTHSCSDPLKSSSPH